MSSDATEIKLGGLGGQGVVLAGLLLGQAAVNDGMFAAGSNSYGAQARGSACEANLVVADQAIGYPHVEAPHLLVAMSQGAYDAYRPGLAEDGVVFYDSGLVQPGGQGAEFGVSVEALAAEKLKRTQAANVIWVGVVAGATGWFSEDAVKASVRQHVPERFLELNLRALDEGLELGRALRRAMESEAE